MLKNSTRSVFILLSEGQGRNVDNGSVVSTPDFGSLDHKFEPCCPGLNPLEARFQSQTLHTVAPQSSFEPWHDKTNKVNERPAKTQICPVWSESSLSAWRNLGSLATHWAHSKDSDQTGRMPRLIWVCWAHTHFVGFVMWLICPDIAEIQSKKEWKPSDHL